MSNLKAFETRVIASIRIMAKESLEPIVYDSFSDALNLICENREIDKLELFEKYVTSSKTFKHKVSCDIYNDDNGWPLPCNCQ